MKKLFFALLLFAATSALAQVTTITNADIKTSLKLPGAKVNAIGIDSINDFGTNSKLITERASKGYSRKAFVNGLEASVKNFKLSGSLGTYRLAYKKGDTAWHTVALEPDSGIVFTKAVDVNGDSIWKIKVDTKGGTYLPTGTIISNTSSINFSNLWYTIIGNVVTVNGYVQLIPNLNGNTSAISITLPIAKSAIGSGTVSGIGSAGSANGLTILTISGSTSLRDECVLAFITTSTAVHACRFTFSYIKL
jgi:hypothetical protein